MGGCGGLERTNSEQFLLWEGVLVWNELIFISFYVCEGVKVCGRTDFDQFLHCGRVYWSCGMKLIFNSFYIGKAVSGPKEN